MQRRSTVHPWAPMHGASRPMSCGIRPPCTCSSPASTSTSCNRWVEIESGAVFDPSKGRFVGERIARQKGIDTFWYNWSLNNPRTRVLE